MLNLWKLPEITCGHIKSETDRYRDALKLKLNETILEQEFSALMQLENHYKWLQIKEILLNSLIPL